MTRIDYVTGVSDDPGCVDASEWNDLLFGSADPCPFMRHEFLSALHRHGCASPATGWSPRWVTVRQRGRLAAACLVYDKSHSYGEYVFDWAWANAHHQHGVPYYPKGLVSVPFTPVPGARLLADSPASRERLVMALMGLARDEHWSSLHVLFCAPQDVTALQAAGWMLRTTVQFHWTQPALAGAAPWVGFDAFLQSLNQEKRKKIRQERRKVTQAGVTFRWARGRDIGADDWDFFYRCYAQTYREHGNPPYLNQAFFREVADTLADHWLMFTAERADGTDRPRPIACSLIGLGFSGAEGHSTECTPAAAYGRYWGAVERVDCLHFEACYYQPLEWCLAHGVPRFEGGAQGEHKMARALMPVSTTSAHWLAHPAFADAVGRFLDRETQAMDGYLTELAAHTPFRRG